MDELLERAREHFAAIDEATATLRARTGLACPDGCGACCRSPEVEASPAELAPAADALVRAGEASAVLAEIERRAALADARCVLYRPDPADDRRGRCALYAERPFLCRLFAFAARRDRHGRPELVACATMRAAAPTTVAAACADVASGGAAPVFGDALRALAASVGESTTRRGPINAALREALLRALLRRQLELSGALTSDADGDPTPPGPANPRTPSPRRAA